MARYAAPRYGVVKVLFLEAVGGVVLIWIALSIWGRPPAWPPSAPAWRGLMGLAAGSVIAANIFFFGAVQRIEGAPASVTATIERVVGALLALTLFSQRLTLLGWVGLAMVVGGVAAGYVTEGLKQQFEPQAEEPGRPV